MTAYLARCHARTIDHERRRPRPHIQVALDAAVVDRNRHTVGATGEKNRGKDQPDDTCPLRSVELDAVEARRQSADTATRGGSCQAR